MTPDTAVRALLEPAPFWMGGPAAGGRLAGNWQTIVSARLSRAGFRHPIAWRRQRWNTPDGDFIDVDFASPLASAEPAAAPPASLVVFHGLEGSSEGHYARALAAGALDRGWRVAVPHFRGCSGELNRGPRAYHSGDWEEIAWILHRLRTRPWGDGGAPESAQVPGGEAPAAPMRVAGISLGGNALLRWAEEAGSVARADVAALAAVSAPLDLVASGAAIDQGFNRRVYARMFLRTMVPKALAKWAQHPGLFDRGAVLGARTIRAFDDAFTAPIHGFRGVDDYWTRASAKPGLGRIRVPALVLNARNDPFVPGVSLPEGPVPGSWVELVQPAWGGHLGFARGRGFPGSMARWSESVLGWLAGAALNPSAAAQGPVAASGGSAPGDPGALPTEAASVDARAGVGIAGVPHG